MTILSNYVANSLQRVDFTVQSLRLVVDVPDFSEGDRRAIIDDLISNMARGSGRASWCVREDGLVVLEFQCANQPISSSASKIVYISSELVQETCGRCILHVAIKCMDKKSIMQSE